MVKNNIQVIIKDLLYFGGDVIQGVVKLEVVNPIKSRGVRLLFTCFEETLFTGSNHARYIHFVYRHDFTGAPHALRKSAPVEVIAPGSYEWGFNVRLPDNVLPSFKLGKSGVFYQCCAYVNIPHAFDLKHKVELNVGGNYMHYTGPAPVLREKEKKFKFGKGHLGMTANTQDSHVYMGEDLHVHVAVRNKSKKPINDIRVTLTQLTLLYSRSSFIFVQGEVSRKDLSVQIPKHSDHEFDFTYIIPNMIPTIRRKMLAVLIDVDYELKIELLTPWSTHLSVTIPVSTIRQLPTRAVAPPVVAAPATQEENTVVGDAILAELGELDEDEEQYLLA